MGKTRKIRVVGDGDFLALWIELAKKVMSCHRDQVQPIKKRYSNGCRVRVWAVGASIRVLP